MTPLEPRQAFDAFGAWTLAPQHAWPSGGIVLDSDNRRVRAKIRQESPSAPGVYGMIDDAGELTYVGQSKTLRDRLLSYFSRAAAGKAQRIVSHTKRLVWETAPDQFAAFLRELELIRRWRPRFNVQGQPNRLRPTYLILGRGPARYVYLSATAPHGEAAVFGPLRASRRYRQAVHVLNDCFQLRACGQKVPMQFADQRELFPSEQTAQCLRHDLGTCLAPCALACCSRQYRERVRAARRFLCGDDTSVVGRLNEAMQKAADARQYEQAAVLRDSWDALDALQGQLQRLREARRHYSFIYPVPAHDGGQTLYLIRRGQVLAAFADPADEATLARCQELIDRAYSDDNARESAFSAEDTQTLLLVAAWFRRHPDELLRTVSPAKARSWLAGRRRGD